MCNKISNYELVELLVPADASTRINFTDIPNLRNQDGQKIVILDAEVFPIGVQAASQLNPGVAGLAITELVKANLVLYSQGAERIKLIPLAKLVHVWIPNGAQPVQDYANAFELYNVEFQKSYVQFTSAPAGGPYVIPIGITYLKIAA